MRVHRTAYSNLQGPNLASYTLKLMKVEAELHKQKASKKLTTQRKLLDYIKHAWL